MSWLEDSIAKADQELAASQGATGDDWLQKSLQQADLELQQQQKPPAPQNPLEWGKQKVQEAGDFIGQQIQHAGQAITEMPKAGAGHAAALGAATGLAGIADMGINALKAVGNTVNQTPDLPVEFGLAKLLSQLPVSNMAGAIPGAPQAAQQFPGMFNTAAMVSPAVIPGARILRGGRGLMAGAAEAALMGEAFGAMGAAGQQGAQGLPLDIMAALDAGVPLALAGAPLGAVGGKAGAIMQGKGRKPTPIEVADVDSSPVITLPDGTQSTRAQLIERMRQNPADEPLVMDAIKQHYESTGAMQHPGITSIKELYSTIDVNDPQTAYMALDQAQIAYKKILRDADPISRKAIEQQYAQARNEVVSTLKAEGIPVNDPSTVKAKPKAQAVPQEKPQEVLPPQELPGQSVGTPEPPMLPPQELPGAMEPPQGVTKEPPAIPQEPIGGSMERPALPDEGGSFPPPPPPKPTPRPGEKGASDHLSQQIKRESEVEYYTKGREVEPTEEGLAALEWKRQLDEANAIINAVYEAHGGKKKSRLDFTPEVYDEMQAEFGWEKFDETEKDILHGLSKALPEISPEYAKNITRGEFARVIEQAAEAKRQYSEAKKLAIGQMEPGDYMVGDFDGHQVILTKFTRQERSPLPEYKSDWREYSKAEKGVAKAAWERVQEATPDNPPAPGDVDLANRLTEHKVPPGKRALQSLSDAVLGEGFWPETKGSGTFETASPKEIAAELQKRGQSLKSFADQFKNSIKAPKEAVVAVAEQNKQKLKGKREFKEVSDWMNSKDYLAQLFDTRDSFDILKEFDADLHGKVTVALGKENALLVDLNMLNNGKHKFKAEHEPLIEKSLKMEPYEILMGKDGLGVLSKEQRQALAQRREIRQSVGKELRTALKDFETAFSKKKPGQLEPEKTQALPVRYEQQKHALQVIEQAMTGRRGESLGDLDKSIANVQSFLYNDLFKWKLPYHALNLTDPFIVGSSRAGFPAIVKAKTLLNPIVGDKAVKKFIAAHESKDIVAQLKQEAGGDKGPVAGIKQTGLSKVTNKLAGMRKLPDIPSERWNFNDSIAAGYILHGDQNKYPGGGVKFLRDLSRGDVKGAERIKAMVTAMQVANDITGAGHFGVNLNRLQRGGTLAKSIVLFASQPIRVNRLLLQYAKAGQFDKIATFVLATAAFGGDAAIPTEVEAIANLNPNSKAALRLTQDVLNFMNLAEKVPVVGRNLRDKLRYSMASVLGNMRTNLVLDTFMQGGKAIRTGTSKGDWTPAQLMAAGMATTALFGAGGSQVKQAAGNFIKAGQGKRKEWAKEPSFIPELGGMAGSYTHEYTTPDAWMDSILPGKKPEVAREIQKLQRKKIDKKPRI